MPIQKNGGALQFWKGQVSFFNEKREFRIGRVLLQKVYFSAVCQNCLTFQFVKKEGHTNEAKEEKIPRQAHYSSEVNHVDSLYKVFNISEKFIRLWTGRGRIY